MEHPSGSEEEGNAGGMEKLDSYLELAKGCMEAVQKMSSPKFNNEQIGYLADKLSTVVKSAGLFSEMLRCNQHGPHSSSDVEKWVEIYKLVLALAKQIESFVQGCCRDTWVEAAMTLSDVAEYVSSLGFNLELCRVVFFEGQCGAMHCGLTLVEVDGINKAEVESVKQKASVDKDSILKKVTLELDSSDLAKYLLQRLVRVHPGPTPDEGTRMGRLFDWVISGSKPKQLGRGASATVYKVMWLGTPVAKKTFFGSGNLDFLKEVDILSRLHHPNIMSMFCSTMNKKNCSIIMELMDGDLFSLMERRCEENNDSPPFSISEAIDIMLQVAEGVNYLHTKGIVHRDLKSMNILVKSVKALELETGYVQAKVVDFGLSKTKERSTTFSNMTYNEGTSRWMAPEMIKMIVENQEYTTRSEELPKYKFKCDIYSFAMVCYEILTGDLPFKDEVIPRIVKEMVLKGERPELPPYCPSLLKTLIQQCWSSEPEDRPTFGIICSRLKYLKYLLIRGEIIEEGAEPTFDHTRLREDDMMALTLKVDGSSETEQFKNTAIYDTSLTASPSVGGACVFSFFTKSVFEGWFPNRCQDIYTFEAFTAAASTYPVFGSTGTIDDMKREVAAFFANVSQETAGFMFVKEPGAPFDYCDYGTTLYPPAPGKAYYGRGPIQLAWNYHYGECGQDLGLDLLADPDQVAEDGTIAFKTALWFWMKRNCHGAIIGPPPSFAGTIRIIGGAIECGHGTDQRVENRVNAYTRFCSRLDVHPGTDLRC